MILLRIPIRNTGSTHAKNTKGSPKTIYSGLITVKNNITAIKLIKIIMPKLKINFLFKTVKIIFL